MAEALNDLSIYKIEKGENKNSNAHIIQNKQEFDELIKMKSISSIFV